MLLGGTDILHIEKKVEELSAKNKKIDYVMADIERKKEKKMRQEQQEQKKAEREKDEELAEYGFGTSHKKSALLDETEEPADEESVKKSQLSDEVLAKLKALGFRGKVSDDDENT